MEDHGELARHEVRPSDERVDDRSRSAHFQLVCIEPVIGEVQNCSMGSEVLDQFDIPMLVVSNAMPECI